MRSGLLWFDDAKNKPLSAKINEASKRYIVGISIEIEKGVS